MAESADATDLKSVDGDIVRVRPPLAPQYSSALLGSKFTSLNSSRSNGGYSPLSPHNIHLHYWVANLRHLTPRAQTGAIAPSRPTQFKCGAFSTHPTHCFYCITSIINYSINSILSDRIPNKNIN